MVDQFDGFGMAKGMRFEAKGIPRFISQPGFLTEGSQHRLKSISTLSQAGSRFCLRREKISLRIPRGLNMLFNIFALCGHECCDLVSDRHFVIEHICFANVTAEPPTTWRMFQTGIPT